MTVSGAFKEFRAAYPAKEMQRAADNTDELELMPAAEGRYDCPTPEQLDGRFIKHSSEPTDASKVDEARYLWVVAPADVPVGLEKCRWATNLESEVLKHSNLTGGGQAHVAGELWFLDKGRLVVNGASGRYGPTNEKELSAAVDAFRIAGYSVASMGWDTDNKNVPNTVPVGRLVYLSPIRKT